MRNSVDFNKTTEYRASDMREILAKAFPVARGEKPKPTFTPTGYGHGYETASFYETSTAIIFPPCTDKKGSTVETILETLNRNKDYLFDQLSQQPKKLIFPVAEELPNIPIGQEFVESLFSWWRLDTTLARNHWVTLCYDPETQQATVLDSRGNSIYGTETMLEMLTAGINDQYPFKVTTINYTQHQGVQVLNDWTHCGAWTATNIIALANGTTISDQMTALSPDDLDGIIEHNYGLVTGTIVAGSIYQPQQYLKGSPVPTSPTTSPSSSTASFVDNENRTRLTQEAHRSEEEEKKDGDEHEWDDVAIIPRHQNQNNHYITISMALSQSQSLQGERPNPIPFGNINSPFFPHMPGHFYVMPPTVFRPFHAQYPQTSLAGPSRYPIYPAPSNTHNGYNIQPQTIIIDPRQASITSILESIFIKRPTITILDDRDEKLNDHEPSISEASREITRHQTEQAITLIEYPAPIAIAEEEPSIPEASGQITGHQTAQPVTPPTYFSAQFQLRCIQALLVTGFLLLAMTILISPGVAPAIGLVMGASLATGALATSATLSGASFLVGLGLYAHKKAPLNIETLTHNTLELA